MLFAVTNAYSDDVGRADTHDAAGNLPAFAKVDTHRHGYQVVRSHPIRIMAVTQSSARNSCHERMFLFDRVSKASGIRTARGVDLPETGM